MTQQHVFQEQGHRTWTILRLFYTSLVEFRRQFQRYNERVVAFAQAAGIDRKDLRLPADDLAGLLDFKKLEDLRDGTIHQLKDLCHEVFRSGDRTDLLDRYVSDIFHEISILKEEHYTVKTYVPMYERDKAEEAEYILEDARNVFPRKLKYIRHLFRRAQDRLEELLPTFSRKPIVIRSLYLERNGFVREAYPGGLKELYRLMYPWGPLEGYYEVGRSFYEAGFFPEALEAFLEAEASGAEAREKLALAGKPADDSSGDGASEAERPSPEEAERARGILEVVQARIRRLRDRGVELPEAPSGNSLSPASVSGAGRAG